MTDEELIESLRLWNRDDAADLIEEYGRAYTHLLREFDKRGDRIEALVKANRELVLQGLADSGQAQEAYEAQLKAEARAERLEAALRFYAEGEWPQDYPGGVLYAAGDDTPEFKTHIDYGNRALSALKGADHD